MSNYKLDELITVRELRRNIAEQFQQHSKVTSPQVNIKQCQVSLTACSAWIYVHNTLHLQVVDILIYKGREELEV